MSATVTTNLNIPLLDGNDHVAKDGINDALNAIDENALNKTHVQSPQHFPVWEKDTPYTINDIVRTTTGPQWGVYACIVAGTSDPADEPQGYGEGDIIVDGTVTWRLCKIAGGGTTLDDWSPNTLFERRGFCIYQGRLYQCLVTHTSGTTFDPSKWKAISVDIVPFQTGRPYTANDFVLYGDKIYYCKTTHIASDFIPANWQIIYGKTIINDWAAETDYEQNEVVVYEGETYRAKATFTSGTEFDPADWENIGISRRKAILYALIF